MDSENALKLNTIRLVKLDKIGYRRRKQETKDFRDFINFLTNLIQKQAPTRLQMGIWTAFSSMFDHASIGDLLYV